MQTQAIRENFSVFFRLNQLNFFHTEEKIIYIVQQEDQLIHKFPFLKLTPAFQDEQIEKNNRTVPCPFVNLTNH